MKDELAKGKQTNGEYSKMNEPRKYEYDAILHEDPDSGGAYVIFPWDLKKEFGKGRICK